MRENNNILEILLCLIYLARHSADEPQKVDTYLEEAEKQVLRLASLDNERKPIEAVGTVDNTMSDLLNIKKTDTLDGDGILVELSDGRTLLLTLDQILEAHPVAMAEHEEDVSAVAKL